MKDDFGPSGHDAKDDLSAVLSASRLALRKAFAPVEGLFQRAGEQLSHAVAALDGITVSFGNLSRRMAEDELASSTERMETVAAKVAQLASSVTTGLASLGELTTLTKGIEDRINRLNRTIGEVQVLGINAKIEAAHVTARNVDFSVFTREIGRLAELAGSGLAKLSDELSSLAHLVESARSGQEAFEKENQQSLTTIVHRLEANLQKVKERQFTAVAASAGLGEQSRSIAEHVAKVVGDLQIADITRQRVEHVEHGLDLVGRLLSPSSDEVQADLVAEQRIAVVAAVCRLEAAQLRNANADFTGEIDQIVSNLRALAAAAEEIRSQGEAICGSAAVEGASFLTELSHDLDQARSLLEKYSEAHAGIGEVTRSVSAGVAEMVKYLEAVHSIEADMRVMGLNATLKCGRLGQEGRALSVIAQELRGFANRTAEDSAIVMRGLQQLIAHAETLVGGGKGDNAVSISELIDHMTASVRALEAASQNLAAPMASLDRDSVAISGALTEAVAQVTSRPDCVQSLDQVVTELNDVAARVPKSDTDDVHDIRSRVLGMMKGRYTMASEHEIHELFDQIESGASVTTIKAKSAPAAAADIDDLLF